VMASADHIQASPEWQTAVFLAAALWILVSVVRGWGKGLMRQLTGLVAFFAAGYLVLNYSSRVGEFLSPYLSALFLFPLAAILIWILSFNIIALVGRLLFKRTRDCESPIVRLIYGVGGGIIGLGYGLLFVWCVLIGLKVIGRIAENQVEIQRAKNESSGSFVLNFAKLKNSVELGYGRTLLDSIDPLPRRFYRDLDKYSRVIEDPEAMQKLLEYPGFRRIWESPQIVELERDPRIVADLQRGDIVGILTNRKVVALLNDPQIRSAFTQGDLEAALNYALTSRGTAEGR
jgi:Colicin V production protein